MTFQVVEADPAWTYRTWTDEGNVISQRHYGLMSLEDIAELDLSGLVDDDAVLFLWVTWPLLGEIFKHVYTVGGGLWWGFEYKTCAFDWVKHTINGRWHYGTGHWTRANTEPCLLFTKGRPKRVSKGISQILTASNPFDYYYENGLIAPIRRHSQKPVEFYEKVEVLIGEVPRLRLFARDEREGWTSLGNELTGNDIRVDLDRLRASIGVSSVLK